MAAKTIMTEEDIRRTLARMAHEIIERNRKLESVVLIGVHTRGVPLARRLARAIEHFAGVTIPVGALDIVPYRDDLHSLDHQPELRGSDIPVSIVDKAVVLADDVLYTGRSVRAALEGLIDRGRPRSIQLAVLVDRGHRELPIRADYVGKNIPSSRHEEIRVRLREVDGTDAVDIVNSAEEEPVNNESRRVV